MWPTLDLTLRSIHKAQGLTLNRVVIDAGDDERSMGLLFVALTRVRHPSHVSFDPVPTLERVTTNIARKASLHARKEHERMLRAMQASTARRHSHLCPPVSALHPQESAMVKPKSFHPARCCPSCVLSSGEQPKTQPNTHPKTPFGKRKAPEEWESASKTQHGPKRAALCPSTASRANSSDENSVYANPLDHVRANRAKLTSLGLQPLDGSLSAWNRPGWLTDALPWLRMRARIVDFWAYEPTNHIWEELCDYLVYLGFEVAADVTSTQRPSACGYIAARSIVTMHAADDWRACDVSGAADACWVSRGNHILTNPRLVPTEDQPDVAGDLSSGTMLNPSHIHALVTAFARQDAGLPLTGQCDDFDHTVSSWAPKVSSRDDVLATIVQELHKVATAESDGVPLQFFVSNDQDSTGHGRHWATVALSIEPDETMLCDEPDWMEDEEAVEREMGW